MTRGARFAIAVTLLSLLALPGMAAAQGLGAIGGTIVDESGAVLPGASVTLVNPGTIGGNQTTATDGRGANLRTGPSTSAPIITTMREGTAVEAIGEPINAEGRSWRQIRAGAQQGWVVSVVVRAR